jgi:type IV pilus biogenesis protein CpaD/CtpE
MTRRSFRAVLLTAALLALGACDHDEEFAFARDSVHAPACNPQPFEAVDGGSSIPGFGCASDAILRAMVVDTRDLEGGQEMAAPAGDVALAAVRRYRAGEVKPPVPTLTGAIDTAIRPGN